MVVKGTLFIILSMFLKEVKCFTKITEDFGFSDCLNNILKENFFNDRSTLVWTQNFCTYNVPIVVNNIEALKQIKFEKINNYIIETEHVNLTSLYNYLTKRSFYDGHGKTIIIANEVNKDLLNILFKYYVYNVIIILRKTLTIYTYHPFTERNLKKPNLKYITIGACHSTQLSNLFYNKIPMNWNKTTLNVVYFYNHPFVIPLNKGIHGLEVSLFLLIQEILKFKVNFKFKYNLYGLKIDNDYTKALGSIQHGEFDTGIGTFHLLQSEHLDFDVSVPIWMDHIQWCVPKSKYIPAWQNIFLVFAPSAWIFLLILAFIVAFLLFLFSEYDQNMKLFRDPVYSMVIVIETIIGAAPFKSKCFGPKYLFFAYSLFIFMITSIYNSKLLTDLVKDTRFPQIETMSEMINSDLKLGMFVNVWSVYNKSDNAEDKLIAKRSSICDYTFKCASRMAFQKDMATVFVNTAYKYRELEFYLDTKGKSLIHPIKENSQMVFFLWMYRPGFPMTKKINDILRKLQSSGIMYHYYDILFNELYVKKNIEVVDRATYAPLNFHSMEGVMFLLATGVTISFSVFLLEITWALFKKWKLLR